ncbi:MAG: hypothetical protein AAF631_12975, partial [Pseudomonadota bacterium]
AAGFGKTLRSLPKLVSVGVMLAIGGLLLGLGVHFYHSGDPTWGDGLVFGLVVITCLPPFILSTWSSWRPRFVEGVKNAFRKVSFNAIADGISPLNVLAYIIGLWGFASLTFTTAAYYGLMAPDHPDIFHNEFELFMVQEVSELDEVMETPENASDGQPSAGQASEGEEDSDTAEGGVAGQTDQTEDSVNDQTDQRKPWRYNRGEYALMKDLHGSLDFEEGLKFDKDDAQLASRYISEIPLVVYHSACRLNWAKPTAISAEDWSKKFFDRVQDDSGLSAKKREAIHKEMDRSSVCERLLPAEYSIFMPAIYALDVTIPLLDLRQESQWSVRVAVPAQGTVNWMALALVVVEALFILMGWIFALVVAGAVTGLSDPTRRNN